MALQAGARLGPYEVLSLLGAGGMGEVYRARDIKLQRDVALKVLPSAFALDADRLARFKREAQILASLNHPHIAAIYGFEESNSIQALVMELVEGSTLADRIAHGPLPVEEALKIASDIADALEAAHEHGIVHRDLKPANINVTPDDRVKVLDFGLAKMVRDDAAADPSISPTMTAMASRAGVIAGTAAYMSPEQAKGKPIDKRTDIWAFGCVLYELLAGERAFPGEDISDSLVAVLTKEPDWTLLPRTTPARIVELLHRCLKKDPRERLRDIGDARIEILSDGGVAASSITEPRRRTRALGAAAVLLLVSVAAGILIDRRLESTAVDPPIPRRLTFERGEIGAARFAPDGSIVVYSAEWGGQPAELFTARLDSRESRPLGVAGRLLGVSSTSELAVELASGATSHVARVPLAGGAPRAVVDHVGWADWSPDGADLAVVRQLPGTERIEFPIGKVLYETSDWMNSLRVSPRGDWLAFAHHSHGSDAGSVEVVSRTGERRALSSNWTDLYGIAWRPDGREIWFTAARGGEVKSLRAVTLDGVERLVTRLLGQVDLYDVGRNGQVLIGSVHFGMEMRALSPASDTERDLTWLGLSNLADMSSDGQQVLFTVIPEGAGEGEQIYLRRTDGTPAVRLGAGRALALSPDGTSALCLTSPSSLVLLPTGVGTVKTFKGAGLTYLSGASWFPDGRRIAFVAKANDGAPRMYVQDIDGGSPIPVGPPVVGGRPVVAPDGRTIAALTDTGPVLFTIGASDARPCPGLEADDLPMEWSPDGRALFFTRRRPPIAEIHRLELSTGRQTLVRPLGFKDPAGVRTPGFVRVTPDGKYYAYSYERVLSELYLVEGLK